MRTVILPAALAVLVLPVPAVAQEVAASAEAAPLADLAGRMGDAEQQRETALMLRALAEVVLDMPIAPLAQAAAEMTGRKAQAIDPDLTLRSIAPGAGRVGEEIERGLPQAMAAVGTLAEAFATMAPALEDMAARLRQPAPESD